MIESLFVYNSIILSPLLLCFFKNNKYRRIIILLISIIVSYVVFLTSIRFNVGSDFTTYRYIYGNINNQPEIEYGFAWLIHILNYIELPSQSLFVIVSVIIYSLILYSYKKHYSIVFLLTWMLLFFIPSLNLLRQYLTMAILTISIFYLKDRRVIFLCLTILAGSFHNSGYIGILFLLLPYIKVPKIFFISLLCPLFIFISLPELLLNLNIFSGTKYEIYLYQNNSLQALTISALLKLSLPYFFIYKYREVNDDFFINLFKNAMLIYIALTFLSVNFYFLYRVNLIFMIFIPFIAMKLIQKDQISKLSVILYIAFLIIFMQKIILTYTIAPPHGDSIYPYQTIFTDNPVQQYLRK